MTPLDDESLKNICQCVNVQIHTNGSVLILPQHRSSHVADLDVTFVMFRITRPHVFQHELISVLKLTRSGLDSVFETKWLHVFTSLFGLVCYFPLIYDIMTMIYDIEYRDESAPPSRSGLQQSFPQCDITTTQRYY